MHRLSRLLMMAAWWVLFLTPSVAAEKFIIMTPGPSVPYTPLHYGVEAGFFKEQGIEVQVLAVRAGQIGVASLTSGEVDAITHAGTGVAAAIRGLPVKVISVSNERPNHEMLVLPTVRGPQDLKGKSLGIGSLEGTGGIIVRRILQAKGLNPDKDVTFISMATEVRLQALISSTVAGAMMSPPYTFLAVIVDPYPADLNAKMTAYLKDWGFEVASLVSLGTSFTESSVASIGDIYRAAKKAIREAGKAEAVFIPCANFPVVDVIEDIETDFGLPVISNITSQLYVAFKAIGMREKINGYGKIMRML